MRCDVYADTFNDVAILNVAAAAAAAGRHHHTARTMTLTPGRHRRRRHRAPWASSSPTVARRTVTASREAFDRWSAARPVEMHERHPITSLMIAALSYLHRRRLTVGDENVLGSKMT